MKKIFTLAFLMVAVLSVQAAESILGKSTFSPWSSAVTIDGNHLTFADAWTGAGFWLGIDEDEDGTTDFWADWCDYDYLVYEVADVNGSFNLCVEYYDEADESNTHSSSGSIGTNGYGFVQLDGDWNDNVRQTWIQTTGAGASITIVDLILMDEEEFAAYKESKKPQGDITKIWEGETSFDNSWPAISIGASAFEDAEPGDKLLVNIAEITTVDGWEWGTQIFVNNGAWRNIDGLKVEGITEAGEISMELTAAHLDTIAATGGAKIQGMACRVNRVCLMKAGASNATVAWEGENVIGNWDGSFFIPAINFDGLIEGSKLTITFTEDYENAEWWQFKLNRGDTWDDANVLTSNAADLNDWGCATMSRGQETYSFTVDADDAAAIVAGGLRIQGYYVTVTKVSFEIPAGVQNIVVPAANDVIYNLCGQRVDASYKGLVIRNGKKYLNK